MRIKFTKQNHQEIADLLIIKDEGNTEENKVLRQNVLDGFIPRFLYLLKVKGHKLYKIGITNDLPKRKRELQTGNPMELNYVFAVEADLIDFYGKEIVYLERFLHQNYEECRVLGEWYELSNLDVCKVFLFLSSSIYARGLYPVHYISNDLDEVLINCKE